MTWRQRKFLRNSTRLTVLVLLAMTIFGFFEGFWAEAALVTGAVSMTLLIVQFQRLLRHYYDSVSRIEVYLPVLNGLILGTLVACFSSSPGLALIAILQIAGWLALFGIHRHQRQYHIKIGPGLMPANVWWNPPTEAIRPGDIIMMEGIIARNTRNSVGHVELVVMHKGKLSTVSAYFEKGVVIFKTVRALLRIQVNLKLGWAVIRPVNGFTDEQNKLAIAYAQRMFDANRKRVERDHPRVKARLDWYLPDALVNRGILRSFMPAVKAWIWTRIEPTGYDRRSYRIGTHQKDLWTCKYIVEQTARHAGVPVEEHESGALGLGTGLLNPPYPMSLMNDPAFRLVTTDDQKVFEADLNQKDDATAAAAE